MTSTAAMSARAQRASMAAMVASVMHCGTAPRLTSRLTPVSAHSLNSPKTSNNSSTQHCAICTCNGHSCASSELAVQTRHGADV